MAVVLITGGTGMIGKVITKELVAKGHHVIILTRDLKAATSQTQEAIEQISYAAWDVEHQQIDASAIQQADYIIHLAGASVAEKRWTLKRKKEIINSRTKSAVLLVNALKENKNKVKAVISASAIGWYGEDPVIPNPEPFVETEPADESFLGETCKLWEESIKPVKELGIRLVKIRIGIVLSNAGGALVEFKKPLRFGVAGILGNGKQIMSWIHIEDVVRIFLHALENKKMTGVYNAVAPYPLTNKEFTLLLAKKFRGLFYVPIHVPIFVLKLLLGEMSVEVLKSANVSCDKIHKTGFTFQYPKIQPALQHLKQEKGIL